MGAAGAGQDIAEEMRRAAGPLPVVIDTNVVLLALVFANGRYRDPFDVPFLHLALAGKAKVFVTGDQDLLALSDRFACPILTADQFINTLTP